MKKGKISFFRLDLKRAFLHKGFFLAILMLLVIFIHAIRVNTNLEGNVSTYEIISVAMALSGFTPFAAIFPSIGYSTAFCEEYHSGYLKMISSRTDWRYFGMVRMTTTGLAGGMCIAIPFAAVCAIGYIYGVHGVPQNGLYAGSRMQYYLEAYGDSYLLVGKVLLGFLFGIMWSLAGMAFSVWFCNKYVALLAPFILYEVMWISLHNAMFLNPIYLIRGDDLGSYPLSAAMEIFYIIIAVMVIWFGLKRRMCHE